MAEKRENSVLFSLRELRQIEDDRIKQEELDARAREEAARRAREDAEQRAVAEAERQRREAEEAERRRVDEEQRRTREDQLRLDEAERRARVEGQMKLEEQRLKMELEAKVTMGSHKKPTVLIAVSVLLFLVVGGLGVFLYVQHQEQQKTLQEKRAQQAALLEAEKQLGLLKQNQAEQDVLLQQLTAAKSKEEADRIAAEIARKKQQAAEIEARMREAQNRGKSHGAGRPRDDRPKDTGIKKLNCDPSDPLCGVGK